MSYSKNPHLPRVRMQAVLLVRSGWSTRKVARHLGFHHTAIMRWIRKAPNDGRKTIPTISSRPRHHPSALSESVVNAVITQRNMRHRCAEVVHQEILNQGLKISLSSVKRTLKRQGLLREHSLWKKWRQPIPRPEAESPGDLLQIDTIHIVPKQGQRFYIYTLIDLYSRWAYALVVPHINTIASAQFVAKARAKAPFKFRMIQSDNGSEFSKYFTLKLHQRGLLHRHSRVRHSNDNSYIERFNRTLEDECLYGWIPNLETYQSKIIDYLPYYNGERLHLGIKLKTPLEVVPSY